MDEIEYEDKDILGQSNLKKDITKLTRELLSQSREKSNSGQFEHKRVPLSISKNTIKEEEEDDCEVKTTRKSAPSKTKDK